VTFRIVCIWLSVFMVEFGRVRLNQHLLQHLMPARVDRRWPGCCRVGPS
jgi:hypothetical protein